MIRFIRDPAPPNTQFRKGMVRDLGATLEAQFIASGDAVSAPDMDEGDFTFFRSPFSPVEQRDLLRVDASGNLLAGDGSVRGLSEVAPVARLTANGVAIAGASLYRGVKIAAIVGGPQTILVYDGIDATGTLIDTIVVNALGTWLWDRPSDLLPGVGGRRPCALGVYVTFSGGTSRAADVMVEAQ